MARQLLDEVRANRTASLLKSSDGLWFPEFGSALSSSNHKNLYAYPILGSNLSLWRKYQEAPLGNLALSAATRTLTDSLSPLGLAPIKSLPATGAPHIDLLLPVHFPSPFCVEGVYPVR